MVAVPVSFLSRTTSVVVALRSVCVGLQEQIDVFTVSCKGLSFTTWSMLLSFLQIEELTLLRNVFS